MLDASFATIWERVADALPDRVATQRTTAT